ncbi:MAG TPA: TIGR03790 family protein [Kiritimatiellia bacterium]|nr:TIGR03790 family protein [Kiritimatiellia bacterium]HMP33428.1 TIGR03790 family protein [Kiritimatiellia bacterium]
MNHPLRAVLAAALIALAPCARALGPQECIILVNRASRDSIELANVYADLRQIPAPNIIHLDLPERFLQADASITVEEFRSVILEPTRKVLRDRGLLGHTLVWLYSLDFPATVATTPAMSLTGITFVRGQPPSSDDIQSGNWLSPLFAGPDRPDGPTSPPASFERFTIPLGTNMPVPSMMLGWSGSRGMTVEAIKQQLRRSIAADAAQPSAAAFFELNDNVRSTTRAWQFDPATRELAGLGIAAFTGSNAPPARADLIGVFAGRAEVHHPVFGTPAPGAYADHLTSFAGLFTDPYQSKLTTWLARGAAASSGTVTEPGSLEVPVRLWAKFPSARLLTHYASGATMIESLYLATRSPLQTLFVGDALCSPWSRPPGVSLLNMADDENAPLKDRAEFLASSWGGLGQPPPTMIFFLDGRPVNHAGNQPSLSMDTTRLHDGHHELRVVAYANDHVRHQGMDILRFTTRNRGRWSKLGGYEPRQKVDLYRPLRFTVTAAGQPQEVALVVQERIVARAAWTNDMAIEVHPLAVGAGPVSFQAVVAYDGKEPVRSEPLLLEIAPLNRAPVIEATRAATNEQGQLVASSTVSDPDGDPVTKFWFLNLVKEGPAPVVANPGDILTLTTDGMLTFAATNRLACAVYPVAQPSRLRELAARFTIAGGHAVNNHHHGGLVFNYLDENNYMYWGLDGQLSAWVLVRKRDGNEERVFSRGAPVEPGATFRISALAVDSQQMAFLVNDDVVAVSPLGFGAGGIGVRNGLGATRYDQVMATPPSAVRDFIKDTAGGVLVEAGYHETARALVAAVRDAQLTTVTPLRLDQ